MRGRGGGGGGLARGQGARGNGVVRVVSVLRGGLRGGRGCRLRVQSQPPDFPLADLLLLLLLLHELLRLPERCVAQVGLRLPGVV